MVVIGQVMIILASAVLMAALFIRMGLGPIIGYLIAGLVIGPFGLGLIEQSPATHALGELGVVFLMFAIGLELPVARIKTIGATTFLLGGLQVFASAAFFSLAAMYFLGGSLGTALAIGIGFSLSSTAIVLRVLIDAKDLQSRSGRTIFAILMVQDLLVGPLLVMVVALGQGGVAMALGWALLKAILALTLIFRFGHQFLTILYQPVAAMRTAEVFTGLSVLVVLTIGSITHYAGLSLAFGGFLAGMLLADTHYRHQVAADIAPFRGLLLGLFFITVGMEIDIMSALRQLHLVVGGAIAVILFKAAILYVLVRIFNNDRKTLLQAPLLLAQGGEFAFVIWGAAVGDGILDPEINALLIAIVALTMAATPFLNMLVHRLDKSFEPKTLPDETVLEAQSDRLHHHVIIIGCNDMAVQVAKRLAQGGRRSVAIDNDEQAVRRALAFGINAFYGDPTQPEILSTLHVEEAKAIIMVQPENDQTQHLVGLLHYLFPDLPLHIQAKDEKAAAELIKMGVNIAIPAKVETSIHLTKGLMNPR